MGRMDILEGLNPEQLAAVNHNDGPMLVVAGAGTGKTQVITRRIARLIRDGLAKPEEVLALTFTEKAAQEMSDRLHELVGWQSFQVPVMTFNAFGSELLGRFASHIGRSVRGGLVNSSQKTLLLVQHISEIDLKYYTQFADKIEFCERLVAYIEKLQNAGVDARKYAEFVSGLEDEGVGWHPADIKEQRDLADVYALYEQIKRDTGTFDFSDQLSIPLEIMRAKPNIAERLRREYKFVLVDEYQDTSPVQDQLLRSFIPEGGNIFAVGDDDQAIYGFRGSDIENILSFKDHFGAIKAEALVRNYRSGQDVLDAAYRLIIHNDPHRLESILGLDKRLVAVSGESEVAYHEYASPLKEYDAVAEALVSAIEDGLDPNNIAVLSRSNANLRRVATLLKQRNVPFKISATIDIFEKREIINLWYLLEWLNHRASQESIGHLIIGPYVGWSPTEYREVLVRAKNDLADIETTLRFMSAEGQEKARELTDKLDQWRLWAQELTISQLAYKLVFDNGLAARLVERAAEDNGVVRIFEDLHLLLNQMLDFETVSADPLLAGYMASFVKQPTIENKEEGGSGEGVNLLTVHASKGLEFDVVYLIGCTARAWSEKAGGSLELPEGLIKTGGLLPEHEQRRLMYVAATRAKKKLILSAAAYTLGGSRQSITPLLAEMLSSETLNRQKNVVQKATLSDTMDKLQRFYVEKRIDSTIKLPFETDDGWIELGVGAAGLYNRCPYEFYLQHVLKITEPFGVQLSFGDAIHRTIQAYFEAKLRGEKVPLDYLTLRLEEIWSDRGYDNHKDADTAKNAAISTISDFYRREELMKRDIVGVEAPAVLEVPEAKLRLKGRIDAIFRDDSGIEIRDFKTGLKRDEEKISKLAKESFQLRTYALAYKQMTGQDVAAVTLDYVVTGTEGHSGYTAAILRNHRDKLVKIAEGIRAGNFEPAAKSEFHKCPAFRYYGEPDEGVENGRD